MPYNYLLDSDLLHRFENMIGGSVLVFDEAHNVAEASCEGRSYELLSSNLQGAELELNKVNFTWPSGDLKAWEEHLLVEQFL